MSITPYCNIFLHITNWGTNALYQNRCITLIHVYLHNVAVRYYSFWIIANGDETVKSMTQLTNYFRSYYLKIKINFMLYIVILQVALNITNSDQWPGGDKTTTVTKNQTLDRNEKTLNFVETQSFALDLYCKTFCIL